MIRSFAYDFVEKMKEEGVSKMINMEMLRNC